MFGVKYMNESSETHTTLTILCFVLGILYQINRVKLPSSTRPMALS